MISNLFFRGLGKFLPVYIGRDARRRFSMSLRFWLTQLVTSAPFVGNDVLSPLAIFLEGVLVMPARFPVLAGHALWYPRIIIGVLALANLTSMLPVVSSAEVSTPRTT